MFNATRAAAVLMLMAATAGAQAHDLFVSFANPNMSKGQAITAVVSNGTFDESAGAVTSDRVSDVSLYSGGAMTKPDMKGWTVTGKQSRLDVEPNQEGTVLLGVSTRMSKSTRTSAEFATYLDLEDLPDTLATYDATKYPEGVTYGYTKHARAVGQVGHALTDDYSASLGYPLEIRLARNPGSLKVGDRMTFQVLHEGKPVPNLRVHVGSRAEAGAKGGHSHATLLRTDGQGQASFDVTSAKTWYIHTNYMVPSNLDGLDFVSDRASLTFDVSSHGGMQSMDHAKMTMSSNRPADHRKMADDAFMMLDTNKDGSLSKAEFAKHHEMMGTMHGDMSKSHGKMAGDHHQMADDQFASLDKNRDGGLSKSEVPAEHPLAMHFDMLDTNKDGSVSKAEFDKHHGM